MMLLGETITMAVVGGRINSPCTWKHWEISLKAMFEGLGAEGWKLKRDVERKLYFVKTGRILSVSSDPPSRGPAGYIVMALRAHGS